MRIVFVKADKIGSKLIRWGTGEPASHVGIIFDTVDLAYHSYATGIREETKEHFTDFYDIVAEVKITATPDQEKQLQKAFKEFIPDGNTYDWPALLYFGYRAALHKFLNRPYPVLNSWQEHNGFLCTEITYISAELVATILGYQILSDDFDLAMVTPWGLFLLLVERIKKCSLPFSYSVFS